LLGVGDASGGCWWRDWWHKAVVPLVDTTSIGKGKKVGALALLFFG